MGVNRNGEEKGKVKVKKYSLERCADRKARRYSDEAIAVEVDDFVREVVEAVAYIVFVDHQKVSTGRRKRALGGHVAGFEGRKRGSLARNCRRKGAFPLSQEDIAEQRYRRVTVEQLPEREKKTGEQKKITAEKVVKTAAEEKRRKKEKAQKEKEKLRREQEEAKKRKREEDLQRKEQKKRNEREKKERKRMEEEIKKQKKQKEEEEREKKRIEEEERREKRRKEEEVVQLKKKRESDRFLSFFDKKEKPEKGSEMVPLSVLNVLPFFCKQGVSLAPVFRRKPLSKEVHDSLLEIQPNGESYLSTVKSRTVGKVKLNRAKLFQFHDNWRPAYYGTWRKRSTVITGRRPFAKDAEIDYEVDSDEEWEIPEGDDCDESTMSEEDEENSDPSTDNDSFIVQHGYLSEGEGEDEQDRLKHQEDSSKRAERLRAMANEWKHNLEEKSKKFNKPLVPLLWGPYIELPAKGVPEEVEQAVFFEYSDDSDIEDETDDNNCDNGSSGGDRDDVYVDD
uniref:Chromatin assembly factor 1 subunit A n=1 Tax=Setaria digitata TaxID=48799 RepID=A0A915PPR3_9BILA